VPRRFSHLAFNLVAAASLVLCVSTCALWVRSFFVGEKQSMGGQRWVVAIHSCRGRVLFQLSDNHERMPNSLPAESSGRMQWIPLYPLIVEPIEGDVFSVGAAGFGMWYGRPLPAAAFNPSAPAGWAIRNWGLLVPYWFVVLFEGMLAMRVVKRAVRAHAARGRRTNGLCPACGYDLRATPERCPECGRVSRRDAVGSEAVTPEAVTQ